MAGGRSVGVIFAELDLDASRYLKSQASLLDSASKVTLDIEQNYKNLGIKSAASFDLMKAQAENAYQGILHSANATADDIVRAEQAKNAKLQALNDGQFGAQTSMLDGLKTNWIAATAAIGASILVIDKAWGFLEMGAQYQEQKGILDNLAAAYGTDANSIVASMKHASGDTVANADLMKTALAGVAKGLNPDELVNLADAAHLLGKVVGQDTTTALEDLSQALESGRTRSLKGYMGTTLDLKEAFGGLMSKITDTEKTQAMYDLVMIQATSLQSQQSGSVSTLADKMEVLTAKYKDAKLYVADSFASFGIGFIKYLDYVNLGIAKTELFFATLRESLGLHLGESVAQATSEVNKYQKELDIVTGSTKTNEVATRANAQAQDELTVYYENQLKAVRDTVQGRVDASKDAKKAATEAAQEARKIEHENWLEAVKEANQLRQIKEISGAEAIEIDRLQLEQEQKQRAERMADAKHMYSAMTGYAQEAYSFELQELDEQKEKYIKNGDDKNIVDAWYTQQKLKLDQTLTLSSDDFIGGVIVGYQKMETAQYTWAKSGLDVFSGFASAADTTLALVFDGAFHGHLKSFSDYWKSFWDSMYKTVADSLAKMLSQWLVDQAAMQAMSIAVSVTGGAVSGATSGAAAGATAGIGTGLLSGGALSLGEIDGGLLATAAAPYVGAFAGLLATYFAGNELGNLTGRGGGKTGDYAVLGTLTSGSLGGAIGAGIAQAIYGKGPIQHPYTLSASYDETKGLTGTFSNTGTGTYDLTKSQEVLGQYQAFLSNLPSWVDPKKIMAGVTDPLEAAYQKIGLTTNKWQEALGNFDSSMAKTLTDNQQAWETQLTAYYTQLAKDAGTALSTAIGSGLDASANKTDTFASELETQMYNSVQTAVITAFASSAMEQNAIEPFLDAMNTAITTSTTGGNFNPTTFADLMADPIKNLNSSIANLKPAFDLFATVMGGIKTSITGSSYGNVFASGEVTPFAYGDIFNKPTYFPMAKGGTGLLGEAGPEAVMPLIRGKDGKLGVKSQGGSMTVNFNLTGTVIDRAAVNDFAEKIYPRLKKLEAWGH
jgi:hypothetical protein